MISNINIKTGRVFIPPNVDRDKYVELCLSKERVSVVLDENGGMLFDCYIDKQTLTEIKFPIDSKSLGSPVVLVQKRGGCGVIIATFSYENESQFLKENSFKIKRNGVNGDCVSFEGDVKGNTISLQNTSKTAKAKINISVAGGDNSGELNLYSNMDVNLTANKNVNMLSFNKIFLSVDDSEGNNTSLEIMKDKIMLGSGIEPLLLGTETKTQLEKMSNRIDGIINALNSGTPSTGVPDSGLALITSIKASLLSVNNKESFTNIESKVSFVG